MKKEELADIIKNNNKEYDLSLVPYEFTYNDDLQIICHKKDVLGNEHGVFITKCGKIKRGDGCPACSGRRMNKELFIAEAKKIHGDDYNYDNFIFIDKKTKGKIFCNKHKIEFLQSPNKHLIGHGCPKCRYEKSSESKTHSTEFFIEKAKKIHGDKYDYSKSNYIKGNQKVEIICHNLDINGNEHGSFFMTPDNHCHTTRPQGCPKCGRENAGIIRRSSSEEFINKSLIIHGNKYDYSKVNYELNNKKVCIICPKHGEFWMEPTNHLIGQGCPKCANIISKGEDEVFSFIKDELQISSVKQHVRDIIPPYELDIYIPDKKIAIEYDGLVWHSEKFIRNTNILLKTNLCLKQGIRLIHIFEDEWLYKKDIVKSRLNNILGLNNSKIYARKCNIKEVTYKDSKNFLDKNHIQGSSMSMFRYGLYYNDELVSLMTFGRLRQTKKNNIDYDNEYELLRFCNKLNTSVVGGASKLLKHFIKIKRPLKIISYADRRWSDGHLYETLGFTHTHDSRPNYFYVVGQHRENRFKYRKGELVKQGFDSSKSEHEIMLERKIYRIYDCGTMVFEKLC